MRGLFVTGTDTGVGKTVVAASILAALRERGERVAAFKPVLTGTDEPADADWPPDDVLLAGAAGMRTRGRRAARASARRSPPTSRPRWPGAPLDPAALRAAFAGARGRGRTS